MDAPRAGYFAMQRGDTRDALEWYEQYVALVHDSENGLARHLIMARAAEAYFLSGPLDDATRLTERAIADATFANAPHYLALARRVEGQILSAQDWRDEAARAFDEAIAAFIATGSRLELARTMYRRAALRPSWGIAMPRARMRRTHATSSRRSRHCAIAQWRKLCCPSETKPEVCTTRMRAQREY